MGTPRKINAILLNIKTNRPKLVNMCVDIKLTTYLENFIEIYLTQVINTAKSFRGLLFLLTLYILPAISNTSLTGLGVLSKITSFSSVFYISE